MGNSFSPCILSRWLTELFRELEIFENECIAHYFTIELFSIVVDLFISFLRLCFL